MEKAASTQTIKRTVELVFVREDGAGNKAVLASERGIGKHGQDKTALPGGHCNAWVEELGRPETRGETAEREAREELGEEFAALVRAALAAGRVAVVASVDDVRKTDFYDHLALVFTVPYGIGPDPSAPDAREHTNLRWRPVEELAAASAAQLYPPHFQQVCAFLAGDHRYAQVESLQ